jgi:hypothetical protein
MRSDVGDRIRVRGRVLAVVSAACILGWAVPALLMLDKGFAVQDEGTYVLSYRWWSSNPYFVSGSQYVYGPLFEAFGESIPGLRLLRLAMVLGANAWFAWSFLSWLEQQRGALPSSRASLVLLLTAGGGMSYLWAPLTPGYYDLTADASLALVALMLMSLRAPRGWQAVAAGLLSVVLVATKWPAAPVCVLTVGVVCWSLARGSRAAALRYAALVAAGVAVAVVVCQLFVVPVGRFVSVMRTVSSLTATASHGFGFLARAYASDTASFALGASLFALPLLGAYLLARRSSGRGDENRARWWLVGAALLTAGVLPFVVGWHGGSDRGRAVVAIALGGLLAALVIGLLPATRGPLPGDASGPAVVVVLLLVPLVQAAGTNVPLIYVTVECVAMWMALILMLVSHLDSSHVAVTAVLADLAVFVVGTALLAGSTTLVDPFNAGRLGDDTTRVPGLGVRVAPDLAGHYRALTDALGPYVVRGVTPVLALDQKAGLTYLLGGVPAGPTWTDRASAGRTAGILALACRNGDVSADRRPVLILDRSPDPALLRAMATCGFDYPSAYRRLPVPDGPPGITVLVPRSSLTTG